jgi:ABC-type uncharacterized transport system ATPase subunit
VTDPVTISAEAQKGQRSPAIAVENIVKRYGTFEAVSDVSFSVAAQAKARSSA